jgi:hypothetical protein
MGKAEFKNKKIIFASIFDFKFKEETTENATFGARQRMVLKLGHLGK